jgi:hypothetical protein
MAYSAIDKILHWPMFIKALNVYQVIPGVLVPAVSYAVPGLELVAAAAIAIPWFRARGLELAAWLLAGFTTMIGYATITAPGVPCGCSFSLGPTRATVGHVALNVVLMALAWTLASSSPARRSGPAIEGTD